MAETETAQRRGRRGGGRDARHQMRSGGGVAASPYITRGIPPVDILTDEAAEIIEANAEIILEEIGIDFLEDAEALELVTRACTAAAASGQLPGAAAAPGTHAGGASATAAAVDLEPALTRLCRQHAAGDCVVSVEVSHVPRLWGGMGAVLEAHASTGSGVSA